MNYDKCLEELERMLKHGLSMTEVCREYGDVASLRMAESFEAQAKALEIALEIVRNVAATPVAKPEKWRVVHTATDEEMRLAVNLGREPRGFSVMWHRSPGQDFSREAADALGAAYIAATGDHRVRIEEVEE